MKRPNRHRSAVRAAALAAALCIAPGCGGDGDEATAPAPEASAVPSSQLRRDDSPDAVRARRLIDEGQADLAAPLVDLLAPELGVEGPLLHARLSLLEGDKGAWLELVEAARAMDPKDPRPYATAAELYAAIGRVESATSELKRGQGAVGSITPELRRAQGVVAIVTPGAGRIGLGLLEAALAEDPGLPFMGRPLGQAYLLAAKRAMAENQGEIALERIEQSLEHDPQDREARRTYAEVVIATNRDFETGLEILEQLVADGEPIEPLLGRMSWSAGVQSQINEDFEAARRYYLRARELGAVEVEQGLAKTFLFEQADAAFERAVEAAVAGDDDARRLRVAEAAGLLSDDEASGRYTVAERFVEKAQFAVDARDLDRASRLLDAAEDTDPSVASLPRTRGAAYFHRAIDAMGADNVIAAVAYAEESTRANPDDALAQQLLGELYYAREEYALAAPALDRAMRNADLDGEPLGIDVVMMLAQCQHLAGDVDDAIGTLEQRLREPRPEDEVRRDEAERYLRLLREGQEKGG